ncbi:MAG TPA: hypothetical protein EYF95_00805 [Flavobacteriales bacterium]|nr:hypothetical protein [Flavobacteriales bacterium]
MGTKLPKVQTSGTRRIKHVQEILEKMGCDPFEGLADICTKRGTNGDYFYGVEVRVPCLKELAQYVAPKLRSMEHSVGEDGTPLGFQIINFGGMSNGLKDIGNNQQSVDGGEHGPVLDSVHVRRSSKSQGRKTTKDNDTDNTSNRSSKPKGNCGKQQCKSDDNSGDNDDS